MPSFILIRPTVWPQYTNVTDRTDRQDRQRTDSIGQTVLQTVAQKLRKKSSYGHHGTKLSCYIFATKVCIDNRKKNKVLLNRSTSSTCPHNMVNFGPLTAEIGWRVWGTPANFNGFRVWASLLRRRRSTEVNKNMHDVWSSPGLVH